MNLGLKFLLCLNGKIFGFENLHSDIIEIQLQEIHSCKTVGKGVCITRVGKGRNYYNNINRCQSHKI